MQRWLHLSLICLLGLAVYSNTWHAPFVFDDEAHILENRHVRLTSLELEPLVAAALRSPGRRPVASVSFALNHYLGGYAVEGFRAVNIAIHALNGVLVYLLALRLLERNATLRRSARRRGARVSPAAVALFTACLFVAHPVQTQSVTYVVQRMTSLAVLFYLLALLLYVEGRRCEALGRRWGLWCAGTAAWILCLGTKQIGATLPFAVWLIEWFFFRDLDRAWLRRGLGYAAALVLFVASLAFVFLGANPLDRLMTDYEMRDFSLGERLLTQLRVVVFYLGLLFFPHPDRFNLAHAVEVSRSLFQPITTLLSLGLLTTLAALAVGLARRERLVSFCVLWFLLQLALESSFIPLELIFEHRLYLPMFGVSLLVADSASRWLPPRAFVAVAAALGLALGAAAWTRNGVWRDDVSLWSDVAAKSPGDPRAHANLGVALARRGGFDEASAHFRTALRIAPEQPSTLVHLGSALLQLDRGGEALAPLREAVRLDPESAEAQRLLGVALAESGRLDEAQLQFEAALREHPDDLRARNGLGAVLARRGRIDEAIATLGAALRLAPEDAETHHNLGVALELRGRREEARHHLSEARRLREAAR